MGIATQFFTLAPVVAFNIYSLGMTLICLLLDFGFEPMDFFPPMGLDKIRDSNYSYCHSLAIPLPQRG